MAAEALGKDRHDAGELTALPSGRNCRALFEGVAQNVKAVASRSAESSSMARQLQGNSSRNETEGPKRAVPVVRHYGLRYLDCRPIRFAALKLF